MHAVTGIFASRADAERAFDRITGLGIDRDHVSFLVPGMSATEVDAATPTTETEGPGMGTAIGAVVGGASGAAIGSLGAAAASLLIPGVGPVAAIGLAAMALFGAGGAVAGATAGGALENEVFDGLPKDELFVYEEALARGKTVVIVQADDADDADRVREVLDAEGAESIDKAREEWWLGIRDEEAAAYPRPDFSANERSYRRGFERAHQHDLRGKSFDDARAHLTERDADLAASDAYRAGFERGQQRCRARIAGDSDAADSR